MYVVLVFVDTIFELLAKFKLPPKDKSSVISASSLEYKCSAYIIPLELILPEAVMWFSAIIVLPLINPRDCRPVLEPLPISSPPAKTMFPLSSIAKFDSAVRVPSPSEVKNLFSASDAIGPIVVAFEAVVAVAAFPVVF